VRRDRHQKSSRDGYRAPHRRRPGQGRPGHPRHVARAGHGFRSNLTQAVGHKRRVSSPHACTQALSVFDYLDSDLVMESSRASWFALEKVIHTNAAVVLLRDRLYANVCHQTV